MALVVCPDCQTQVSDQAPACIKCGRPMKMATEQSAAITEKKKPLWVVICKGLGFVVMLWGVVSCSTSLGSGDGSPFTGLIAFVVGMLIFVAGRFGE